MTEKNWEDLITEYEELISIAKMRNNRGQMTEELEVLEALLQHAKNKNKR